MAIHETLTIISTLLTTGLLIWDASLPTENPKRHISSIVASIFCFITIVLLILWIIECIMLETQEWECAKEPYKVEHIINLNDNTQTDGKVFLRHEYVDEDMCYTYMVKRNDGGYSYSQVKEANTAIYISDSNFRVESYKRQKHWLWLSKKDVFCKIYVPEGCIPEDQHIDLE